jgi:hypothetical protein
MGVFSQAITVSRARGIDLRSGRWDNPSRHARGSQRQQSD